MRIIFRPRQTGISATRFIVACGIVVFSVLVMTSCMVGINSEGENDSEAWPRSTISQRTSPAATAEAFVVALAYHDEAIYEFTTPQLRVQIENLMAHHEPPACSSLDGGGELYSVGNGSDYYSATFSCYLRNSSTLFKVRAEEMTLLKVDGQWVVTAIKNLYIRKS